MVGRIKLIMMVLGLIAASGAATVAWQQMGGPVPATRHYVDEADAMLRADADKYLEGMKTLESFGVDTRLLQLGMQLSALRREMVELEVKGKRHELTGSEVRLKFELAEQARKIEHQIKRLEQR
ncbi:MAG: hypothetical protein ACR2QH_15125 [Geminicoccaceae bacterium]